MGGFCRFLLVDAINRDYFSTFAIEFLDKESQQFFLKVNKQPQQILTGTTKAASSP